MAGTAINVETGSAVEFRAYNDAEPRAILAETINMTPKAWTRAEAQAAMAEIHKDHQRTFLALAKDGKGWTVSVYGGELTRDIKAYRQRGYVLLGCFPDIESARISAQQVGKGAAQRSTGRYVTWEDIRAQRRAEVLAKYPNGGRITDKNDIAAIFGRIGSDPRGLFIREES